MVTMFFQIKYQNKSEEVEGRWPTQTKQTRLHKKRPGGESASQSGDGWDSPQFIIIIMY